MSEQKETLLKKLSVVAVLIFVWAVIWRYTWMSGDGWWYLALGREIFTGASLPETNTLSYTGFFNLVLHQQWFCYVFFYGFYEIGGELLVYFVASVLFILSVAFAFDMAWRRKTSALGMAVVALLGVMAFRTNFSVRSETVIDLLFAMLVALLYRHLDGIKTRLYLIPLLVLTWANSHSSLPLAFVYILLILISVIFEKDHQQVKIAPIGIYFLLGLVASLVNPYTYQIYTDIYLRLTSHHIDYIEIFQAPDFHDPIIMLEGAYLVLLWATFTVRRSGVKIAELVTAAALSVLFLTAQRYFIYLFIGTASSFALNLDEIGKKLPGKNLLRNQAVIIIAILALAASSVIVGVQGRHYSKIEQNVEQAAQFIEWKEIKGNMFNYYTWGGYILWRLPGRKVFIDGRNNLYEENRVFDDYMIIANTDIGWEHLLEMYRVNYIIWPAHQPKLALSLDKSDNWVKVFQSGEALIYVRNDPRNTGLLLGRYYSAVYLLIPTLQEKK